MGAKLIYFSPTDDIRLTEDVDGLILGGDIRSFILKAQQNAGMINSIRAAWREECRFMPNAAALCTWEKVLIPMQ